MPHSMEPEDSQQAAIISSAITSTTDAATSGTAPSSSSSRKRKRPGSTTTTATPSSADTFSRVADSKCQNAKSGRGSEAGWVNCPLCGRHSRKLFALGRGIAAHLHAVHTPWNPGKVERQKRRRMAERRQREQQLKLLQDENSTTLQGTTNNENPSVGYKENEKWEPSQKEIEDWNQRVLQIVKELEEQYATAEEFSGNASNKQQKGNEQRQQEFKIGLDRNGNELKPYRASLPPFIQAAADGDLKKLKEMVDAKDNNNAVLELLNGRDRHLSTAEHWAAGSGHLHCLRYLLELRKTIAGQETSSEKQQEQRKKMRRRDGKTALHYAARNGHIDCINYLIREQKYNVDEVSGDGTTPFHLACFGGHPKTMHVLWKEHNADVLLGNDFDCTAAHWVGMAKCKSKDITREMCRMLQQAGLSFVQQQKQGHTCLHKAAQRLNRHVIEWLAHSVGEGGAGLLPEEKVQAGMPDEGDHTPSDIWRSVGGDATFGDWLQEMGW